MGSVHTMVVGTAGGTENAEAAVDVPFDCRLMGVKWAVNGDFDADLEEFTAQLGFGPTLVTSNDSRSVIDTVTIQANLTTSGMTTFGINQYTSLPAIPLFAGERLYLNILSTAGVVAEGYVHLHLDRDMDQAMSRRRN